MVRVAQNETKKGFASKRAALQHPPVAPRLRLPQALLAAMKGETIDNSRPVVHPDLLARLETDGPTEVVILLASERDYDLDRCVWLAEQALDLHAEGLEATAGKIAPPEIGASVHLVNVDGESRFHFGAPEQVSVVVRTGNGKFFPQGESAPPNDHPGVAKAVRDHRAWVHLALDAKPDEDVPPERTMLLHKLAAGFMDGGALLLHLPGHGVFVEDSESLRAALRERPFAEALRQA